MQNRSFSFERVWKSFTILTKRNLLFNYFLLDFIDYSCFIMSDQQEDILDLKQALIEKDSTITRLEGQIKANDFKVKLKIKNLQAEIAKLTYNLKEAKERIEKATAEGSQSKDKLDEATHKILRLKQDRKQRDEQLKRISAQYKTLRDEVKSYERILPSPQFLKSAKVGEQDNYERVFQERASFQQELERTKSQLQIVKKKAIDQLIIRDQQVDQLKLKIVEQTQRFTESQHKLHLLDLDLDQANQTINLLNNQLKALQLLYQKSQRNLAYHKELMEEERVRVSDEEARHEQEKQHIISNYTKLNQELLEIKGRELASIKEQYRDRQLNLLQNIQKVQEQSSAAAESQHQLQVQHNRLSLANQQLEDQLRTLQQQLLALNKQVVFLKDQKLKDNTELRLKEQMWQEELNELKEKIRALQKESQEYDRKRKQSQRARSTDEQLKMKLQQESSALRREKELLERRLEMYEASQTQGQNQKTKLIQALDVQTKLLGQNLKTAQTARLALQQKLLDSESRLQSLKAEGQQTTKKLELQNLSLQEVISQLRKQLQANNSELTLLAQQNSEALSLLRAEHSAKLQRQATDFALQESQYKAQISSKSQQLKQLKVKAGKAQQEAFQQRHLTKDKIILLQNALNSSRIQIEATQAQLLLKDQNLLKLNQEIATLLRSQTDVLLPDCQHKHSQTYTLRTQHQHSQTVLLELISQTLEQKQTKSSCQQQSSEVENKEKAESQNKETSHKLLKASPSLSIIVDRHINKSSSSLSLSCCEPTPDPRVEQLRFEVSALQKELNFERQRFRERQEQVNREIQYYSKELVNCKMQVAQLAIDKEEWKIRGIRLSRRLKEFQAL